MKVLLDECLDWRLSRDLVGHRVKTARQMGWATLDNGERLALASEDFDVFVTVDRNLSFRRRAKTNRLAGPAAARLEASRGHRFGRTGRHMDRGVTWVGQPSRA
jgi:hypothetical protein